MNALSDACLNACADDSINAFVNASMCAYVQDLWNGFLNVLVTGFEIFLAMCSACCCACLVHASQFKHAISGKTIEFKYACSQKNSIVADATT